MLNKNTFLMVDFETGSRNPNTTQPIQLSAVAIEPRNLEVIPNSEFDSLMKPFFTQEECEKFGFDEIEDKALEVNGKTREELKKAKSKKVVWQAFEQYCLNYNPSGKPFTAPIMVGFNNHGFDNVIMNRLSQEFGSWDDKTKHCKLFNKYWNLDLMEMLFPWFESSFNPKTISMDNMRQLLGLSMEGAHDGLVDVKQQSLIFCQLMKISRKYSKITGWRKNNNG